MRTGSPRTTVEVVICLKLSGAAGAIKVPARRCSGIRRVEDITASAIRSFMLPVEFSHSSFAAFAAVYWLT
jgi:hypothetical protein